MAHEDHRKEEWQATGSMDIDLEPTGDVLVASTEVGTQPAAEAPAEGGPVQSFSHAEELSTATIIAAPPAEDVSEARALEETVTINTATTAPTAPTTPPPLAELSVSTPQHHSPSASADATLSTAASTITTPTAKPAEPSSDPDTTDALTTIPEAAVQSGSPKLNATNKSPKSPKSPRSPKSPKSPKSPVQGSQTEEDEVAEAGSSLFSTGLSVDSDADSALGDVDYPSSTQSVRSSLYEFVEENGRTFHKYKQGRYFMPNDQSEQERLDLQHAIFVLLLKGQLARAPIQDPHRVLDIGTGTGIWAIEFAAMYPSADVIGTDLSPIQPDFVPPNCRFEIDDAEDDWAYGPTPFDYVHLRLLWHSFNDPKRVLQSAYDNLQPGGYVEWQDYFSRFRAIDDSLNGSAITRLDRLYTEAGRNLGRDMLLTPKIAGMMREVGFVDVVEERYALPGNPWPKGREAKTLGLWQMTNFLEGMQAITMTVLTKGLGMSTTEVELLLMDVRNDVKNTNIHFYIPVYVMYGRKPFPHEVGGTGD